jgi:ABC-type xylose transport system permease subunit
MVQMGLHPLPATLLCLVAGGLIGAAQGRGRADREVDVPGHDDEQHAQRHHHDVAVLQHQVGVMVQMGLHPLPATLLCLVAGGLIGAAQGWWVAYLMCPATMTSSMPSAITTM